MIEERAHLLPLAEQGFELADICFPARRRAGLRAGADQSLFGSGRRRQDGRGPALSELRRGPG